MNENFVYNTQFFAFFLAAHSQLKNLAHGSMQLTSSCRHFPVVQLNLSLSISSLVSKPVSVPKYLLNKDSSLS